MQNLILKIGRTGITILVTFFSIVISVMITGIVMGALGDGLDRTGLIISILAPTIIAPSATWYIAGLLVRIHELEKAQRNLATYDVLTGLQTRRAFLDNCDLLLKITRREKLSLSLAYIDIDDFKLINDKHGHAGGDAVLQSLSSNLPKYLREKDLVGRIGGEEFAIALPETNLTGAIQVLERIRRLLEDTPIDYHGGTIYFTVSIGVSLFNEDNFVDLDSLFRQSDKALYQAKRTGKKPCREIQSISRNLIGRIS